MGETQYFSIKEALISSGETTFFYRSGEATPFLEKADLVIIIADDDIIQTNFRCSHRVLVARLRFNQWFLNHFANHFFEYPFGQAEKR